MRLFTEIEHQCEIERQFFLRRMIRYDIPEVCFIDRICIERHWCKRVWKDLARMAGMTRLVVTKKTKRTERKDVVGYCVFQSNREGFVLHRIAVDPGFRRQSVGSMMLNSIVGRLSVNQPAIRVDVPEYSEDAIRFFRDAGFVAEGVVQNDSCASGDTYRMRYSVSEIARYWK